MKLHGALGTTFPLLSNLLLSLLRENMASARRVRLKAFRKPRLPPHAARAARFSKILWDLVAREGKRSHGKSVV